jgi:hypothetical protein
MVKTQKTEKQSPATPKKGVKKTSRSPKIPSDQLSNKEFTKLCDEIAEAMVEALRESDGETKRPRRSL